MFGYKDLIAVVELTTKTIDKLELPEQTARKYIGGSGLGTYYLFKHGTPHVHPLSPGNPLIFMTGPFVGTGVPASGRHHVVTKSPLTGIYCESDAGGSFGIKLKGAGFDGLIITGASPEPVYLFITDSKVTIKDARHLWGLDTIKTERKVKEEVGEGITVACIGPAGEKEVLISGIFYDGTASRASARGGAGAVMGSKNLKAIAVQDSQKTLVWDKKALVESVRLKNKQLQETGAGMSAYGTCGGMINAEKFGDIPIKNWQLGSWTEQIKQLTGQKMKETIFEKNFACTACPIHCGKIVKFNNTLTRGPEYETVCMLGSACLVGDLNAIIKASDLCNRYGVDTISVGGAIAFAMELYERGIISKEETGRPLTWGDPEVLLSLVEEIGQHKGFGKVLGQGVKRAAEKIGKDAARYAIHTKGLELPAHDPRCFKGLAVGYATSNRGACHLSSFTYPWERSSAMPEFGYEAPHDRFADEGKGELTIKFQNLMGILDSLKICKFAVILGVTISDMVNWLNMISGWDVDVEEFMTIGARIFNLKRLYNNALGITRKDDTLPDRILKETRGTGGSADSLPDLAAQLDDFYKLRGWSEQGVPTPSIIKQYDLQEFC